MALRLLQLFLHGAYNSVALHRALPCFLYSSKIQKRTLQCILLNGVVFLGSIYFMDKLLLPSIHLLGFALRDYDVDERTLRWMWSSIDWSVWVLYQALWMYPIYAVSYVLNTVWYQDIADTAYMFKFGDSVASVDVRDLIRDQIYRLLLIVVMVAQTFVVEWLPGGKVISFALLSCMYALYCFEYKWAMFGKSLSQRVAMCEERWLFMLGFGSTCTAATYFVPTFIGLGIYAILFPFFVITAICCEPEPHGDLPYWLPRRLRIFAFAEHLVNAILGRVAQRTQWLSPQAQLSRRVASVASKQ